MRILVATHEYFAHHNSFCLDDALELADLGNDVCIVACDRAEDDAALNGRVLERGAGQVRVLAPRVGNRRGRSRMLARTLVSAAVRRPTMLWRLVRAARRRNDDSRQVLKALQVAAPLLVHPADVVHFGWLDLAGRCLDAMPLLDASFVVTCHGSDLRIDPLEGEQHRSQIREVFEQVDLVHCISDDLRMHALELGLDPAKAFVGQFGIDTTYFRPDPQPNDDGVADELQRRSLRVVSVGRLHWVKGYEYALQALTQVQQAGIDVSYSILGKDDGGRLSALTAVRDLGLDGSVTAGGASSRGEVLAALRAADVFLLPSLSEGLNTATLEAMAVGIPVVVTDVGGMAEAVTDGVDGFVVPPRDPHAIATALLTLAEDPDRRRLMGEQGRRRVEADFNITTLARSMNEVYQGLIDDRVRRLPVRSSS